MPDSREPQPFKLTEGVHRLSADSPSLGMQTDNSDRTHSHSRWQLESAENELSRLSISEDHHGLAPPSESRSEDTRQISAHRNGDQNRSAASQCGQARMKGCSVHLQSYQNANGRGHDRNRYAFKLLSWTNAHSGMHIEHPVDQNQDR